ncbi:MAG TPA: cation diffusion facilitator family transporter [Ilumatobacter sp.]|nr:cation diffusion facilitator family transporter [Ilumatobacter sp.]
MNHDLGGQAHGEHAHGPSLARAGERHVRPLAISFVLIATFFVVQAVAGFVTGSLALLSDAGHMLTDVVGLGMALAAIRLASRFATKEAGRHTFGVYRLEILAAFVNALLLFGVAVWVLIEAGRRLSHEPEVEGLGMLVVAALGLVVNLVAFTLLREGSKESLNVEGAYLEVLADTLGSVGVIVAAIAVAAIGWWWADPVVGALIGVWILPRTWRLGRKAIRVLLQAAPDGFDLVGLHHDLAAIEGVVDVHDLHVWTLTSDMDAASAHLVVGSGADHHRVLDQARDRLALRYGVDHGTFQVEPDTHTGCHDLTW